MSDSFAPTTSVREMAAAEADRRFGPHGWRCVSITFDLANGDMELVRVVNLRHDPDDKEATS